MAAPTLSAIVPTYNRRHYVVDALESIRAQTHPVDEIIVVDDGSTDGTAELLAGRYGGTIRYIRQANAGAAAARNRGLREARGDLIVFLDSDDLWAPEKTALQLEFLRRHPELDAVFGDMSNFSGQPEFGTPEIKHAGLHEYLVAHGSDLTELFEWLIVENVIPTPTVMIRRAAAEKVGFFVESLTVAEDFEYWLRAAAVCRWGFLNRVLIARRRHEGNLVANWDRLNLGLIQVLTTTASRLAADRPRARELINRKLDALHYDLGSAYLKRRHFQLAHRHLAQSGPGSGRPLTWRAKYTAASALRWWPQRQRSS